MSSGMVSGKGGGTATITVQMQDGKKNVLYETSCQVKVLQPVKKIILEDAPKTVVLTCMPQQEANRNFKSQLAYPTAYTYQLNPTIFPSTATNQQLSYRVSNPELITVSDDGLVSAVFNTDGGIATVYIEAKDGSGAKTSQKIKVQHFTVTEKEIEMTERGAYRLYFPPYVNFNGATGALPHVKLSSGYRLENVQEGFWEDELVAGEVTKQYTSWFDVRPMKAGKHTLTICSSKYGDEGDCTYTITLKVSESAA